MFRIVQAANAIPTSYPVDPNAEFEPGMIAQLGVNGNNIVCGVSDGTAPLGVIDEIKTRAFTEPSIDEVIIVNIPNPAHQGSQLVVPYDTLKTMRNANVIESSFVTSPIDVALIPTNGVLLFPAGTVLNYDADGDGIPDSVRTVVSYTYQVPNIPGDDSTQGSGRVTVWFTRMIFQTNMFETNQRYPVNANLFVSENGLLTTRQPSSDHPGVAVVTGPPTAIYGTLEALYL